MTVTEEKESTGSLESTGSVPLCKDLWYLRDDGARHMV